MVVVSTLKNLQTIERKDLDVSLYNESNEFQLKWLEIVNQKHSNFLIGVCYRHPKKGSDGIFIDNLKNINKIKKENKIYFVVGDFNYDLLKYNQDKYTTEFLDLMLDNFLQPCILEPTRVIQGNRPSLIDNIFTNAITKTVISGNLLDKLSDHMPNFAIFNELKIKKNKDRRRIRDFSKFDKNKYQNDLKAISLEKMYLTNGDVNKLYETFNSQLTSVIDKHAPYKYLSTSETNWSRKPWITKGIQISIKKKSVIYGKYVRSKNDFWFNMYKYYSKRTRHLLFLSKQKYYGRYFTKNAKNFKRVWQGINQIVSSKPTIGHEDIFIDNDGNIVTDQKKVANIFSRYYANVANNLLKKH